jgi:hypothetical protein
MSGSRRIQDDAGYEKSLEWLVEKSKQIADPLIEQEEKSKLMAQYDYVTDGVQRYRRGQMVQKFPGLRQVYNDLGWPFDEPEKRPDSPLQQPEPEPETEPLQETPAPATEPTTNSANAPSWWDDDD